MTLLFVDLAHYVVATILALVVLLLPGFGLTAFVARSSRLLNSERQISVAWSMALAMAVLPAIDALAIRYAGMFVPLVLHIGLAIVGSSRAMRHLRRMGACWYGLAFAWWGIVAFAYVDADWSGGLNQSFAVLDLVKHAAVVRTIAQDGLPLHDMFFARPGIAGYYYYFYIGPALIDWIAREAIDARTAFMAASFVTGLVFPQLMMLVGTKAALVEVGLSRRFFRIGILLCTVSGFDLIPGVLAYLMNGTTLVQLDWWSEETRWALTSIVWVPHHVSALIAVFVGTLVLLEGTGIKARPKCVGIVTLSGLAFATAFGSSIWITVGAAPILTIWWLMGLRRPDMPRVWMLPASGGIALVLALPQIHDLIAGRAAAGFPLAVYARPFGQAKPFSPSLWDTLIRIALLPGVFAIEFGLFALGTAAFVATGRARTNWDNPVGRLLIVGAVVSLVAASFVRSTVINNDFGWRAIWFAQFSALLWTTTVLCEDRQWLRGSSIRIAALGLGLSATAYDLIGLRFIRAPRFSTPMPYINQHPAIDLALRRAYAALDRTVPRNAIIQHNPAATARVFDFGLYGHARVGVADGEAQLFGADPAQVKARIARLAPLFLRVMPFADARRIAREVGVDYLVVTSLDPVWQQVRHAPNGWPCVYRSQDVCVADVSVAGGGPH
ncbi:hypothetical protein ACWGK7_19065 (plasmid) [Sphingomonas aurantiaca]